jgi:hypothetical protein
LKHKLFRHWIVALGILWGWCAPLAGPALAQEKAAYAASVEYEVKAAFIHNFAKFIDWPEDAFETGTSPVRIGILGTGPIDEPLLQLNGKEVHNRVLEVTKVRSIQNTDGYHIIFVNPSEKNRVRSILRTLKGTGILTVGDIPEFAKRCGVINFYLERGRVRFEINVSAANRQNVKISSKLLKLARIVDTPCE